MIRVKIRLKLGILFLIPIMTMSMRAAQHETAPEYKIKAAFLYNFTQFVEWPDSAFPQPNANLVIGILGDDPFGAYLDETVKGEKVNDHLLLVKRFQNITDVNNCHILFVSASEKDELEHIFENLKTQPILTVGDDTNFTREGGMVRFLTAKNKTRIQINLQAAKQADLAISSKLLGLAEIVNY